MGNLLASELKAFSQAHPLAVEMDQFEYEAFANILSPEVAEALSDFKSLTQSIVEVVETVNV